MFQFFDNCSLKIVLVVDGPTVYRFCPKAYTYSTALCVALFEVHYVYAGLVIDVVGCVSCEKVIEDLTVRC